MTLACLLVTSESAFAESSLIKRFFPSSYSSSIFDKKFENLIEVENLGRSSVVEVPDDVKPNEVEQAVTAGKEEQIEFQTSDLTKKKFLPPDQTPSVAVNPEAPTSIISMIESSRRGDSVTAKAYAKQFVRTLQNYFFEVRNITSLIGEALIEESAIEEEDWIGAAQAIDIELARTRLEKGVPIKPTQDVAMKRIIPDSKNEVDVYYFFSRSCSYCRLMSPDVERLSRAFSGDERVKFTGLVVGESSEEWLIEFRNYTGLQIPVFEGTEFAKKLKIGFLPVLMAVSPNNNRSYFKSGQQNFEGMYEFIRTAQGLPIEDSLKLQALVKTPVGVGDKLILSSNLPGNSGTVFQHYGARKSQRVNLPSKRKGNVQLEKF